MPEELPAIALAKLAIAFEKAYGLYLPGPAKEMAELGSRVLLSHDIRHWISPGVDSITCVKCRQTSYNRHDVKELYCGYCHEFLHNNSPK